jgi:hypothetical protein
VRIDEALADGTGECMAQDGNAITVEQVQKLGNLLAQVEHEEHMRCKHTSIIRELLIVIESADM